MDRVTCPHIKRDGSICGRVSTRITGCARHWKLYEKNMKKRPCLICRFPTNADSGYCAKYYSKYSAKFHALNYRMRQKYKAETRQLGIPEASIFELGDGNESLQPRIPEAPIFELSDVARPLQPRIYEAPVSESDDEDIGLGLFGD
ncbi:hypothetical protein RhiirA1_476250 [Rhizophagus irregularis]|uniref:Uncharacterized protein n=2 Tax=Rhizophagus irregularis TaxID=588596 RepID=A0A2I1FJ94_9GLOM|nr:hypothetical protein RhiirA1_476250 [Rhizophagus irregularis]PKY34444.1 hypothetical protein RhiirB3_454155 [Rhizophagus irregularis]